MYKKIDFKNKRITVMGLGLNHGGLGVAKYLAQTGAHILVTDLKGEYELKEPLQQLRGYDNIHFVLGQHRIEDFINTDLVIQNPAVRRDSKYLQIARECGIPIETDLSLFLKINPSKNLIVITGTKGKSTVTNLVYHTFSLAKKDIVHAGNIGISVFEVLPKINSDTIVLLEISSWQLEGLARSQTLFQPHIAVLTNILADHLDRYDDFADYVASKKIVLKDLSQTDFLITNFDNNITKNIIHETSANIYWFSTMGSVTQGSYLKNGKLFFKTGEKLIEFCTINDIPLPGNHNISNILAASNIFFIYGLPLSTIQNGIKSFPGIANRLEKIRVFKDITFYNDTCATTPDATMSAIESFPANPLILILGGKDKKLNYNSLVQVIKDRKNIIFIAILEHPEYSATHLIKEQLELQGLISKTGFYPTMSEAVQNAYEKAIPGTNIILSPAATSFGMFSNEFERGNAFKEEVNKLS